MAAGTQQAIGKLVVTYIDTNNEEFQEVPFYLNANLLKDGTDASLANIQTMKNKINIALSQMDSLTTATIKDAKVIYEVPIEIGI